MSGFYRSLDRAIAEHDEPWLHPSAWEKDYYVVEPLEKPSGIPSLNAAWTSIGWIDESQDFQPSPMADLIETINRLTSEAAVCHFSSNAYATRLNPAYDDSYLRPDLIDWRDADGITIESRFDTNHYTFRHRFIAGLPPALPLCEQEIPPEGQE